MNVPIIIEIDGGKRNKTSESLLNGGNKYGG